MPLLPAPEITSLMASVPAWHVDGSRLIRAFHFASFPHAIKFVTEVAHVAESLDHHPEIFIQYRTVTLCLTTHSARGLTPLDFQTATAIDTLPA